MPYKNNLVVLALTSLLCYAAAVWAIGQQNYSQYDCEQFIVASALSHAEYGTPIGAVYKGIVEPLAYHASNMQATIKDLLEHRLEGDALGPLWTTLPDSLGIAQVILVSIMFKIFGVTLAVFPALAVIISALSVASFAIRFRDGRLFAIPLHFFVLTVLLLAPISVEDAMMGEANEFPIGGDRYFELLAILPAIHVMFEIFDDGAQTAGRAVMAATVGQVLLLALCIFVRTASYYLVFVIFALVALRFWLKTPAALRRRMTAKVGGLVASLVVLTVLLHVLAPSDYRKEGRVTGALWHRTIVSLGTNPAWPFGDLKERYNLCVEPYTQPLRPGVTDGSGGCVWTQYVRSTGLPDGELVRGFYDNRYEREIRRAFFAIVAEYPTDVAETYFYYKPLGTIQTLRDFIRYQFEFRPQKHPLVLAFCGFQLLLLLAAAYCQRTFLFRQGAAVGAVFLIFSLLPLFLAWANIHTIVDLVYWCFATSVMLVLTAVEWSRKPIMRQATAQPAGTN